MVLNTVNHTQATCTMTDPAMVDLEEMDTEWLLQPGSKAGE